MSKAKPTHELLATIGEYEDRQTGEKKKRRLKIATVFTDEEGRESYKFECMPVGTEWTGWASKFPIRPRDGRETPPAGRYENAAAVHGAAAPIEDDSIPF